MIIGNRSSVHDTSLTLTVYIAICVYVLYIGASISLSVYFGYMLCTQHESVFEGTISTPFHKSMQPTKAGLKKCQTFFFFLIDAGWRIFIEDYLGSDVNH